MAKDEEKRVADEAIENLKSEDVDALTKAVDQIWDEPIDAIADQIHYLKDLIYKAGYSFSSESAGIPSDHELHAKIVLCPLGAFTYCYSCESRWGIPCRGGEWQCLREHPAIYLGFFFLSSFCNH